MSTRSPTEKIQKAKHSVKSWAGPVFVLVMFLAALWFLHRELREYKLADVVDRLAAIPPYYIVLAVLLTVLNYAILVCYDWLGIWYIRHPMKFGRVALASFLGYAVGNNFGLLFGGSTIRYRLYTSWGLSAVEIVKLLFILAITFWIGLFFLSGLVFLIHPLTIPEGIRPEIRDSRPLGGLLVALAIGYTLFFVLRRKPFRVGVVDIIVGSCLLVPALWLILFPIALASEQTIVIDTTRPLGWILTGLAAAYLAFCGLRKKPMKFKDFDYSPPPLGLTVMQYIIASLDLLVAAGILYSLLAHFIDASYWHFVSIFLLVQVLVFLTQVPGGLGVLEASMLSLLAIEAKDQVAAALLAYRMIYYLTPMAIGIGLLGMHEVSLHRKKPWLRFDFLRLWTPDIVPKLLSFNAFLAGVVLLFSSVTPSSMTRLDRLNEIFPVWAINLFHFLAAVVGVSLLVFARGLVHKIRRAYWLTTLGMVLGIAFALLREMSWEVATFLMVLLVAHVPFREQFFRQNVLFPDRFSMRWLTAIAFVVGGSIFLMMLAYKDVDFGTGVLGTFSLEGHAARSFRAIVGGVLTGGVFYVLRLVHDSYRPKPLVSRSDLDAAALIVEASPRAESRLALMGDKRLLMNHDKTSLVQYGIHGKSWVAMGDPVGPESDAVQLAWDFYELCETSDNWPVFYNVSQEWIPTFSEMGLDVIKIGQVARVWLPSFHLNVGHRAEFQKSYQRLQERGFTFEVLETEVIAEYEATLRRISDLWLHDEINNSGRSVERGFSVPSFDFERIQDTPLGVCRRDGTIVGFASIWGVGHDDEASAAIIRYLPNLPQGVTEFLLIGCMYWAAEKKFQWFNLGLAPLSDSEMEIESSVRRQIASLPFLHSQHVFTRHGLRNFKEKFDPNWTPKFLAVPKGAKIPRILDDISHLIEHGETQSKN